MSSSLDGDFNFEGLLHGASLGDFLGNLDDDFVNVGSGDLYLVLFFSHFGVINIAGNLLLFALVDNLDCELRLDGASASGGGTAAAGLALATTRFLSARADNFFGDRDFLPDLLAGGLELTNGTGPDLWDLTSPGHSVHDNSGLFDCFVDHDGLGENFFNRAHLNLLLELLVFNFGQHSLELRLLFVSVLVLNWERLLFNFWRTSAVLFSRTAAALVRGDDAGNLATTGRASIAGAGRTEERKGAASLVHSIIFAEDPVFKLLVVR